MHGTVIVGNKHHGARGIYIGRPSVLGNPFRLGPHEPRGATLERYRGYLHGQWRQRTVVRREIEALARRVAAGEDLTLVCFCAPQPCHGHILAALIEQCAVRIAAKGGPR